VNDVASQLSVGPRTVRRWRAEGRLPPAVEVAGIVRWRPEAIERWLAEQQERAR
jgi:predicted site-specific integrase-resolvase